MTVLLPTPFFLFILRINLESGRLAMDLWGAVPANGHSRILQELE